MLPFVKLRSSTTTRKIKRHGNKLWKMKKRTCFLCMSVFQPNLFIRQSQNFAPLICRPNLNFAVELCLNFPLNFSLCQAKIQLLLKLWSTEFKCKAQKRQSSNFAMICFQSLTTPTKNTSRTHRFNRGPLKSAWTKMQEEIARTYFCYTRHGSGICYNLTTGNAKYCQIDCTHFYGCLCTTRCGWCFTHSFSGS